MSAELKLSELMRGLDLNPGSATLTPAALFSIGRAISDQAQRAELTAMAGKHAEDLPAF